MDGKVTVTSSGGSKISQTGGTNPKKVQPIIWAIFHKKMHKMKDFEPRSEKGRVFWYPPMTRKRNVLYRNGSYQYQAFKLDY